MVKISAAAAILVSVTVFSIIYYMTGLTENEFLKHEEKHARNILRSVVVNVENQYRSIDFYKNYVLRERKEVLKDIIDIAYISLENYYEMYQKGLLSEDEAKNRFLMQICNIRYQHYTGYIWVNDNGKPFPRMVMHPTLPELNGKILDSPEFNCALGRSVNLFRAFVDITEKNGEGYVDYFWPKPTVNGLSERQPKLSYVKLFEPWGWIIGTGLYIDDIDKEVNNRLNAVIDDLRDTLPEMETGPDNYVFIFNGSRDLLVHPTYGYHKNFDLENPTTGNPILDDLKKAAKTPEKSLVYMWNKIGDPENFKYEKMTYLEYFKPLDWYIGSSIYLAPIKEASKVLSRRVLGFSIIFLLLAVFMSVFMAYYLTVPLKKIMNAFKEGATGNYEVRLAVRRKDELGLLAEYFNNFMHEMEVYNKKLRKEINFNSTLVSSSPTFMTAIDPEGRIIMINDTMLKACGYEGKDFTGRQYVQIFCEEDENNKIESLFRNAQKGEYEEVRINSVRTAKGNKLIIEWHNSISYDENGDFEYLFSVGIDITDKRKIEEQLLQTQKMETIGVLAGGLAHDFNNVLGGIIGTLSIMRYNLKKYEKIDREKLDSYLSILEQSGARASDMVKQLLTLSHKQDVSLRKMDLNESLHNILKIAENSFDKSVVLDFSLFPSPAIINADQTQIEQVLLNLCVNAVHSMTIMRGEDEKWGGILSVSIEEFEADRIFLLNHPDVKAQKYWEISIQDSGVGIPSDIRGEIFTPFFTTKRKGEGTGLGLSIVYNVIYQHGGTIDLYSEINKGTSVKVYLPASESGDYFIEDKNRDKDIIHFSAGGLVLVIDDEEVMRRNAETILRECGLDVVTAVNGKEGIELYRKQSKEISVVLLDMAMPGMSGKETYSELKKIDPECRVLLTSGYKQDERVKDVLKMGVKGFVQKPYTIYSLSKALKIFFE